MATQKPTTISYTEVLALLEELGELARTMERNHVEEIPTLELFTFINERMSRAIDGKHAKKLISTLIPE